MRGFPLAGLWNKAEVRFGGKQLLWFIKQYLILKQNMKLLVFVELSDRKTLTELYWNRRFWPFCNTFDAYKGQHILIHHRQQWALLSNSKGGENWGKEESRSAHKYTFCCRKAEWQESWLCCQSPSHIWETFMSSEYLLSDIFPGLIIVKLICHWKE